MATWVNGMDSYRTTWKRKLWPLLRDIDMDETLIIGIGSGLVGAVTTYVFAILKLRKELEFKYDTDLREKRIPQYLELWKLLQDWAKYARPKQLTVDDLNKLAGSLRQWYFEKGGLFLSDSSRDAYFDLQEAIKDVLVARTKTSTDSKIDEPTFETVRAKGSTLRTALTRDVGTRKAPQRI